MKKTFKSLLVALLVLLAVAALTLVACDQTPDDAPHQHTFSSRWSSNDVEHWHAATCGHDETADLAAHDYGTDNVCDTCGYTKVQGGVLQIYSATFIADDKVVMVVNFYEGDTAIIPPDVPQKEHYTAAWENYTIANQNIVVHAVYTPIEYTATFDDGTKQTKVSYTVENTDKVNIPQVTPKQYYTGSWQQYQFDFSNEQVIHADYTPIEYKITFVGNNQRIERTYTVETKDDVAVPEVPVKEHYTGVWQEYVLQFEQNQTVNAVYTPIEYKITFVGNGQRIERTYTVETRYGFVAPEVPEKTEKYYGFDYVGSWEYFYFEFDNQQVVNAVYSLRTPGYTYSINNDQQSYSLTSVANDIENAIVLPFYNDLPVTSIGSYAFSGCSALQTVTFEGNSQLQSIGDRAFRGCSSLTSIIIPSTVTSIGDYAFYGCTNLQTVTFEGDSQLQSIGNYAFDGCSNLQTVKFDGDSQLQSIGKSAFNSSNLTNVYYGGTIGSWCGIKFGDDDANPMYYADRFFMKQGDDWKEVTEIEIPESVTIIGSYQFCGFGDITSIIIPSTVTSIGYYAFGSCSSLTNVYYGGTIGSWCGITFGSYGANPIGYADHFFIKQGDDWQEVTEINIPESVEKIGYYQFYGFGNITSITIPSTVTSIGDYAFYGCTNLQTVTLGDDSQLQSISNSAFYGCSSLTSITIPSTVTSIGDCAFYGCSQLTSITIPSTVTSIGERTFFGCSSLQTVTFEGDSRLQSIGKYAFSDCSNLTEITIPSNVTSIGESAFSGCSQLTSITIPSTVTSIGDYAFYGCTNLQTVTFEGNQLQSIGSYAFYNCTKLTEITIPSNVTSIGESAFSGCSALQTVTFEGDSHLQSIGRYAFSGCSQLTSITIPSTVTTIGIDAFRDCRQLTIYCEAASQPNGWNAQWNPDNRPVEWGYKKQ